MSDLKRKAYLMTSDDYDASKVEKTKQIQRDLVEKARLAKAANNSSPA